MQGKVTAFIPYNGLNHTIENINGFFPQFGGGDSGDEFFLLTSPDTKGLLNYKKIEIAGINSFAKNILSSRAMNAISANTKTDYILILLEDIPVISGQFMIERFYQVAEDTGAGIIYSDHYEIKDGLRIAHPVIDYQPGSVRDDFEFGSILFIKAEALKKAIN